MPVSRPQLKLSQSRLGEVLDLVLGGMHVRRPFSRGFGRKAD
jgi:hypothetical protein